MNRIASFCVDHTKLEPGVYISRVDGDIVTYDIRMRKPNIPPFLPNPTLHTFEHLFATFARNSAFSDHIIYFGPMGCRTGFYFLVRDMTNEDALQLIKDIFAMIQNYTGEIPGNTAAECGNYLEHDLQDAKQEAVKFMGILHKWNTGNLEYIK